MHPSQCSCGPNAGAQALVHECARLLKSGGLLFISDFPLQQDERNRARYEQFAAEFGCHGVFRAGEAVFRHYQPQHLDQLLHGFQPLWRQEFGVRTLNGNAATIVQLGVRKRGEEE